MARQAPRRTGRPALQNAEQQKVRKTVGRTLRQVTPRKAIWSVRPAATSTRRSAAIPTALLPDRRAEISSRSKSDAPPKPDFHAFREPRDQNRPERIPSARRIELADMDQGLVLPWKSLPQVIKGPGAGPAARNERSADHHGNY